jgi:hypothetical protein
MSLELNSLFRKYAGTLANIDASESDQNREFAASQRDLEISREGNQKGLSEKLAGQGLANSGIGLEENVKLNTAYTNAGADSAANHQANMSTLARKRLEAQAVHNESAALSQLTSLLNKG